MNELPINPPQSWKHAVMPVSYKHEMTEKHFMGWKKIAITRKIETRQSGDEVGQVL